MLADGLLSDTTDGLVVHVVHMYTISSTTLGDRVETAATIPDALAALACSPLN